MKHAPEIIGASAVAAVTIASLILLLLYSIHRRRRRRSSSKPTNPKPPNHSKNSASEAAPANLKPTDSLLPADHCRRFSLHDIATATDGFDDARLIGIGGFGKVYVGVLPSGAIAAIKRANPESQQGLREFRAEIKALAFLRHRHLVPLLGFCQDSGEMALVYSYMPRGTLREHLYYNPHNPPLPWHRRLGIVIGAARGLHYLHAGANVIHRDVKTTNILLDEDWVAKVSDFGLSRAGPGQDGGTHVTTGVKGSLGYLDPEYLRRQKLTEKSDVYSFGVVLFEVLFARPAACPGMERGKVNLAVWGVACVRSGEVEERMDGNLRGKIAPKSLEKYLETAVRCVAEQGAERPGMEEVVWCLEFAMEMQEVWEQSHGEGKVRGYRGNDLAEAGSAASGSTRSTAASSLTFSVESQ